MREPLIEFDHLLVIPLHEVDLDALDAPALIGIEHLVHPEHLLASLREALQWAPLLIVSTPERDLARGIVDFGPPGNPCHVREWNLAEFTCLLEHHGLRPGRVGLTRSDDRDHATYTIMAVIRGSTGFPDGSGASREPTAARPRHPSA